MGNKYEVTVAESSKMQSTNCEIAKGQTNLIKYFHLPSSALHSPLKIIRLSAESLYPTVYITSYKICLNYHSNTRL